MSEWCSCNKLKEAEEKAAKWDEAMQDAASVAEIDIAEIGGIIRRQRTRIAFLERECRQWKRDFESISREKNEYKHLLESLGAL